MGQIGTIKLQTQNNGTVSVPVFATGDSGSSVHEFLRVQTASGTGFIPLVAPSDASYPYLRVQSQNHGVVAAHNDSNLITIVDDFEDNDMSEYAGDTGATSVSTTSVFNGTYSLDMTVDSSDFKSVSSTSGLNTYPSQGDTFRCAWNKPGSDSRLNVMFGTQSESATPDCYIAQTDKDDSLNINKRSGSASTLNGTSSSASSGKYYEFEITWKSDGTIDLTQIDPSDGSTVASVSATDTSYSSGGIGFETGSDSVDDTGYFDYYRIV